MGSGRKGIAREGAVMPWGFSDPMSHRCCCLHRLTTVHMSWRTMFILQQLNVADEV